MNDIFQQTLNPLIESIYFLPPYADTDRPILGIVQGEERTLLIDAGNSASHVDLLLSELDAHQISHPDAVVLTHWHWDHVFGAHRLNRLTIAHEKTKTFVETMIPLSWTDEALDERVRNGLEVPFCADMIKKEYGTERSITITSPVITYTNTLEIDLGGLHCLVTHVGGDHAEDSTVIYVKEKRVLFLGDCLYPSLQDIYTIEATLSLLEKLEKFEADWYVASHEMPLTANEFQEYTSLLRLMCGLTAQHQGNQEEMAAALAGHLQRPLMDWELQGVGCFAKGYQVQGSS